MFIKYLHPFVSGMVTGLLFLFSLGPSFFLLIQSAITKGIKAGFMVAVGVFLCDVLFAVLVIFGLVKYLEYESVRKVMAIGGVVVLTLFGLVLLLKKKVKIGVVDANMSHFNLLRFAAKGFLINVFNPFILIFWLAILAIIKAEIEPAQVDYIWFFCGMLMVTISLDLLKASFAHRLRHLITPNRIIKVNRILGVILILFSARVVYYIYEQWLA